ncbi:MAG: ATP-dependent 6-phosphofructokinase [Isosphaerales bacterium]
MTPRPAVRHVIPARLGEPRFDSPLRLDAEPGRGRGRFVPDGARIRHVVEVDTDCPLREELLFEKAGPRRRIFFDPAHTRVAIVTCGGLCPGINSVIRSLFLELNFHYGVQEVLGLRNGYRGLNPAAGLPPIVLTRGFVSEIHKEGGTMLGTSRGQQDVGVMVDFLEQQRIDVLFCVGGDGTHRGAHAISEEIGRRRRPIAVVGVPKTIDNDIDYCDWTFGYLTAVDVARGVIHLAHTEARSTARGVGLVKLMGRYSGYIACMATRASQEVNFVLIPEAPFELHGEDGFLAALERRIDDRDHAVVVVAEGAGQHLFETDDSTSVDASGNLRLHDIGQRLRQEILDYFAVRGCPVDLKYIDPSYIIRSVPPTTADQLLCDDLARRAVHAAMSGRTDMMISALNHAFIHVPISMVCVGRRQVDLESELWSSVLAATGQPPRFTATPCP